LQLSWARIITEISFNIRRIIVVFKSNSDIRGCEGKAMRESRVHPAMLAVAIILLASIAGGTTYHIGPGESLQGAINRADSGDTIIVQGGVYRESLSLAKPITLEGKGRPLLDGSAIGNALTINADGAKVSGFEIRTTRRTGVHVLSGGNIIENNSISGCLDGIRLEGAHSNIIANNSINNNTNGITLYSSKENRIQNCDIRDNYINEESDCGIFLIYSSDNVIQDNQLRNNGDTSISLRSASNNSIMNNTVIQNDWYGISLSESSNENRIAYNNASSNIDAGIYLDCSRNNHLLGNRALDNSKGIYLSYDSNDNILEENYLFQNGKGLYLANHASNNTIVGNTAQENGYGVYLTFSSRWDLVYANHLINNGCNAYDRGESNRWDNGSQGNYYSDLGGKFYIPGGPGIDNHPQAEPSG
jgi:parallel beta-helix repeat protein